MNYCYEKKLVKEFFGVRYKSTERVPHEFYLINIGKIYENSDDYVVVFECKNCNSQEIVNFAVEGWLLSIGLTEEFLDNYEDALEKKERIFSFQNQLKEAIRVSI